MPLRYVLLLLVAFAGAMQARAAETFTLKIATAAPEGTSWMKEMRAGAAAVKQRSAGRVEVKFFPGGVMGSDSSVLRKIKLGQLQGGTFTSDALSLVDPDAPMYGEPFLFRSQAEVDFVRSRFDSTLREGLAAHGMVAAGVAGGGFTFLFSTKPIRNRDELKATKVWAPPDDRIDQLAFESGGVQPITLPLSDVYTALQTGLIETVANTPSGAIAFQWHTKLKFMVDLPLTYVMGILAINKEALDPLAPEDRQAVLAEMQAAFDRIDATGRRDNETARAALAKQGVELFKPSSEETRFWLGMGDEAARRLGANGGVSPEIAAGIRAALAQFRAGSPVAARH